MHRWSLLPIGSFAMSVLVWGTVLPAETVGEVWLGAWAHAPTAYNMTPPTSVTHDGVTRLAPPGYAPLPPYNDQTVREVTRIAAGAIRIRVRLSNEFGDKPLLIGAAHIALADENGAIVAGSDHVLTFAGRTSVAIPTGSPMLSDAVNWALPAFSKLSVSVFYPNETVPPAHTLYALDAYAAQGDVTGATTLPDAQRARSGNHVSEIDIVPATAKRTVVAFGDSITEGVVSTPGAFHSWPDRLAERLQANPATRGWSVVNAGIGSNRLLHDTPSTSALSRFDRDVLSVPGTTMAIVLIGINDIQYTHRYPNEAVNADQIIAALQQLIIRAHAHGIRILGGTVTAFEGSPDYTDAGETTRQAVNQWIRGSGLFDGTIDFDAATRDPQHPAQLAELLESGGHLHPSDSGYTVMGDAVDLGYFIDTQARRGR
jgi:lysophospholipase L1-like esterase